MGADSTSSSLICGVIYPESLRRKRQRTADFESSQIAVPAYNPKGCPRRFFSGGFRVIVYLGSYWLADDRFTSLLDISYRSILKGNF
jgi:hypothetical protein